MSKVLNNKIAYIFPGVGYTKDRPLLYYSGKLAAAHGYELVHLDFSGIEWSKEELKKPERLLQIMEECLNRTEKIFNKNKKTVDGIRDDDIIFISKSIGTVVATAYAKKHSLKVRQICFTPLEYIDDYVEDSNGIIFYGNSDPYASSEVIAKICDNRHLEAHCIDNANHSLETGDVLTDIKNIDRIMTELNGVLPWH